MKNKAKSYQIIDLPIERRLMTGFNDLSWQKHSMFGLLEVDVTIVRQFIEDYRAKNGEVPSFTGYLALCLARAVDENKTVQAYLKGRRQLVLFDDVDVGMDIERKVGEKLVLMGHVIRGANHKTYMEIHQEIRTVQSEPVPPSRGIPPWFRSAMLFPQPFSGWFKSLLSTVIRRDPTISVSIAGTVGITAVGMFGKGKSGWGIAPIPFSLGLIVGSMALKPAVVNGKIEPREILNLTVMFDHDVIDGAPATRFVRRLVELIESGYGLSEQNIEAEFVSTTTG